MTWQWFNVFGARPILGRTFTPEEDHKGSNGVAVLSYAAWQKVFGGDRGVIGQTVMLNQQPYRVIGVMRSDFDWLTALLVVGVLAGLLPARRAASIDPATALRNE